MGPRPERQEPQTTTFDRSAFWRTLATSATVMVLGGGALLGLHMQKSGISLGALYGGPIQVTASILPAQRLTAPVTASVFVETGPIETGSISRPPSPTGSATSGLYVK